MNHPSPNAQAILLLTAPLIVGGRTGTVKPLSLGEYHELARHLHDKRLEPADLLDDHIPEIPATPRIALDSDRLKRLLGRGFLLAQALERWSARAIWVVTRPDAGYPDRLRKQMGDKAPPVLYGCGGRNALDDGGLAVVGSRKVTEEIVHYTERVGQLAAEAKVPIVSGGARGVDQAAMRGSLEARGSAIGVLGNNLERAALDRRYREPLMDERLVLVSSFDPAVRFRGWQAMERNKQIYALADAALVVNFDHGHGGTWAGATEQLQKLDHMPVYVRSTAEPRRGLEELVASGAREWREPTAPSDLHAIVFGDPAPAREPAEPSQGELKFPSPEPKAAPQVTGVREGEPTALYEPKIVEEDSESPAEGSAPGKTEMRLLRVMSGEMSRQEVCDALKLKSKSDVKKRFLDPCLEDGWIEMTMPTKPSSRNQRYRLTTAGRRVAEPLRG